VVTFTAKDTGDVPLVVKVAGVGVHVTVAGAPVHVRAIVPLKPVGLDCRLYVAGWPAVTVAELDTADNEKSAPVPTKATVCALFEVLSTMPSVPVRDPVAVGVNTTEIAQLWPIIRGEPAHVFV